MDWRSVQNTLINACFGLLLVGLVISWTSIAFPKIKQLREISKLDIVAVNLFLSASLAFRWITYSYFPLSNLYESLLFLTWCLTVIQILLEKQIKSPIISSVSIPIQLFIIAFASLTLPAEMQQARPLVPALHSNWLMMHVTVMMLSYACLIIGSLLSILFLIIAQSQVFTLKSNEKNQLSNQNSRRYKNDLNLNYPSIDSTGSALSIKSLNRLSLLSSLDNLSYRIIGLGFPLLTIGIISGAVWANEAWGSYWSWDPKETWALITWLIFASYLHSRLNKSWEGKKPAILASVGFFIVWICYLGVNFLGQGLHSYGWLS
uniref:Cytochrome c biogenesis protein CcsA n=1 Tax=Scinaia undulata TaxID=1884664 RepID=A0A1G4NXE8_9FLOR|nr:Cytochrome c biogenesis protein ccs1 [Scinaia undulata]SCW23350.1 Cytochrome c biogenesis protein ccs1 [Scinaia undulata]